MNQYLSDMENRSKASFISVLKSFFLYTFAYVGIATLSGFFIFNDEQTEKEILINLGTGVLLSFFLNMLKLEKRKEELIEDARESN